MEPTGVLWTRVPEKSHGNVLHEVLMAIRVTDPPQHPFPHPQPQQPDAAAVRPPMVYVYERQQWEYKVIAQPAMSEHELNALGADGWELVGVVALPATTQLYFKRVRT